MQIKFKATNIAYRVKCIIQCTTVHSCMVKREGRLFLNKTAKYIDLVTYRIQVSRPAAELTCWVKKGGWHNLFIYMGVIPSGRDTGDWTLPKRDGKCFISGDDPNWLTPQPSQCSQSSDHDSPEMRFFAYGLNRDVTPHYLH